MFKGLQAIDIYYFFTPCVSQLPELKILVCKLLQSHSLCSFDRLRGISKIIYINSLRELAKKGVNRNYEVTVQTRYIHICARRVLYIFKRTFPWGPLRAVKCINIVTAPVGRSEYKNI